MNGIVRLGHIFLSMENQAATDSGLSATDLAEEKAVWNRFIIEANRIRLRPEKAASQALCKFVPHQLISSRRVEISFAAENQSGLAVLLQGENVPHLSLGAVSGKTDKIVIWERHRFRPAAQLILTTAQPAKTNVNGVLGNVASHLGVRTDIADSHGRIQ